MTTEKMICSLISRAKKAQEEIEEYTQEQADELVKAVGKIIYDHAEELADEAIKETRMGILTNKTLLNKKCTTTHWCYLKDKKSVGVIDDDPVNCVKTLAKPMGVIAALIPTTNPTPTPVGNAMCALKCRNAMVFSPHPRAKNVTVHTVNLMRQALREHGAPEDLLVCIEELSMEATDLLMKAADAVVATGGNAMVKAAYSSGRPAFGVGQGNAQVVIDRGYDRLDAMVKGIIASRTTDNGMPCIGEQTIILPKEEKEQILKVFIENGAYVIEDPDDVEKMRAGLFVHDTINRDIVGQLPYTVAKILGVTVPEDTKLLMISCGPSYGKDEVLCREIMCPLIRVFSYEKLEDGVKIARANLLNEGAGHSSSIYSNSHANIEYIADHLPVGRVLVNMPNASASGMNFTNGLAPTVSIGCGTWGNNAHSENTTYKHFMNVTKVAYTIPNPISLTDEEIWAQ